MTSFLSRCSVILGVLGLFMGTTMAEPASNNQRVTQAKKTMHVGIYAPFTHDSAYVGRSILGAMEIARDKVSPAEIHYEFYTLDTIADATKAASTLQKFIEVHQLNVLISEGSDAGTVVAAVAKKNNLIHFCLGCEAIADGKNSFQAHSPNHQRGALLTAAKKPEFVAQFKQEYFSHPATEAGYAYDIFHLLNQSAVMAMKTNPNFSTQALAHNLLAYESGNGLMGSFKVNKQGVVYKKKALTA